MKINKNLISWSHNRCKPSCKWKDLNWQGNITQDLEAVCQECGSAYLLDYVGYYEEGSNERIEE